MRLIKQLSIAFMAALVIWGCNENQKSPQPKQSVKEKQVQTPAAQEAPSGEADEYGREPGDEHYGHDHPPQDQQQNNQIQQGSPVQTQQAPPSGEQDAYGREPGHEHYGHDHPRRDLEQENQVQQGSPVKTQQNAPSGEPDKYGREPGDEHYGHDHP